MDSGGSLTRERYYQLSKIKFVSPSGHVFLFKTAKMWSPKLSPSSQKNVMTTYESHRKSTLCPKNILVSVPKKPD